MIVTIYTFIHFFPVYFTSKVAIQIMYIINQEGVQAHIQYEEGKTPYDMKEEKPSNRLHSGGRPSIALSFSISSSHSFFRLSLLFSS